ncbi:MerR family transcriptional regulator [Streptomyces finlayi]|uniref:MerR family transcriptional regulator n=1 Tax=Streptomyces finlayi TaxID=67296 RepID=A0A7G7BDP6_9ACTN|nr:MerR family transcriptional regulator [Streptomyces finlayi]QNE73461.1 MerR family transcriptional regulator [Streptomyces finlayi]
MWSIGELAEQAGVSVKTVRFYSDRGLLPEAARSTGGHRRYGPGAVDRLRLIRSLRTLDLPVPEVSRVLDEEDAMEDVIAAQLRDLGCRLAALRWREAALQLLQDCTPRERAERLRLIAAVPLPPDTTVLARFWRRWLPPRMPAPLVAAVVEQAVPQPPDAPNPAQVLSFARLYAFVSGVHVAAAHCQPEAHRSDKGYRPAVLYEGLGEAYALASPELRARRPGREGEALDCFVSAYARSHGTRDTPGFRRGLAAVLSRDPRIDRYWQLVAELTGPSQPTAGAAHDWLLDALDAQTGRTGSAPSTSKDTWST